MVKKKDTTKNRKVLDELYDSAEALLQNLHDADEHVNQETGEMLPDVSRLEKALASFNKGYRLGRE